MKTARAAAVRERIYTLIHAFTAIFSSAGYAGAVFVDGNDCQLLLGAGILWPYADQ